MPNDGDNPDEGGAKSNAESDGKRQSTGRRFKVFRPSTVWSFVVFCGGGALNYFGSNPRILYLPAFAICCLILFLTHGYVESRLEKAPFPASQKDENETPFKASIASSASPAWYVQDGVRVRITQSFLIHFTNLRPTPVMIYSCWIEEEGADHQWHVASLQFGTNGRFFSGNDDLTHVAEFRYTTLDSVVNNRNIGQNETVRGWMFFVAPSPPMGRLRFCMTDAMGNIEKQPLLPIASGAWPSQSEMIESLNKITDISSFPLNQ
jgi:hypothetical protein